MIDATLDKINRFVPQKWQWILSHSGFRKYFKNTGWMFFGQMFNIISFLVGIWLARYLGPKDFGTFSYVLAFVGLFSFIVGLGVNDILTRELVAHPEKRDRLLGTAFLINLGSGFLAFLVVVIATQFIPDSRFVKMLMIIWSTYFFLSSFSVINRYFVATVQSKKNAIIQAICIILVSLLKILLILSGKGIFYLTIIFLSDYVISSILYLFFYYKSGLSPLNWRFDKKILKDFLSVSWLMMLSTVASSIYMKIDQVMMKGYLGEASVGLYTAAVKLAEIWYFIPGIICSSLFPAIINARLSDTKKYHKRLSNLYKMLAVIAVLIAIPLSFLSAWLIKLFYGPAYIAAAPVLRIYIWSSLGLFLIFGLTQQLLAENKIKLLFAINLSGMLLNIILNLIFIPKFGLVGAAWATLISYLLGPIYFFIIRKYFKNKYDKSNII